MMGVSIEKKKNQPEQKIKREANFCSGWFLFFSIDTPINLNQDGCINRKEQKSAWTEVQKGSQLLFGLFFSFLLLIHPSWIKLKIIYQRTFDGIVQSLNVRSFWTTVLSLNTLIAIPQAWVLVSKTVKQSTVGQTVPEILNFSPAYPHMKKSKSTRPHTRLHYNITIIINLFNN